MSFLVLFTVAALTANPKATQARPATSVAVEQDGTAQMTGFDAADLPVSLERIQRALARPPAVKLENMGKTVFRVEVFGNKPTIDDILGPDWQKGPVPYAGMTHQEFLDMVTPKDVRGYAMYSNKEAAMVAATSVALQWAALKAIKAYQEAKDERAREAARQEVQEALTELQKARIRAGLPPK